ncbi:formate-dependent phosphoribosylglycinamide formyltransferase [Mycolicibacterium tokaiense]|uniref:Phosphoribosylglycinamide formyltransferase 2 n=1 Tax=Mycolicibacterium tokaiense TaxID=39695 RepID=A0A378TK12_9MYCO|nr:formate-dependent phosphoribosylglycinamide formyltransferase [Mycolicibacterium tokaiense]STZ60517.1 phosphoribosylglycinamide formyltransferase 2 [Mycolicibacterium tokaiense]
MSSEADDAAEPASGTEPEATVADDPQAHSSPTVLLLGAGENGHDLVVALQHLGAAVVAAESQPDASAHAVADDARVVELADGEQLSALIAAVRPDYVVSATGAVAADALEAAEAAGIEVVPSARSTRLSLDREGLRRLAADELGLPTAPFWFAGSVTELEAIADHAGFPLVVKPLVALPGEGQSVLLRPDDVEPAWERAVSAGGRFTHDRVLAETVVEIDYEVTLLTVRTGDGPAGLHFSEPIGHRQVDGFAGELVVESWQPQPMGTAGLDAAKSIAARVVNALGGRGVFAVELLVRGDEVYFSDVTARPTDSAVVTVRSQRLDVYELHARAVLGLPVDTIMISPAAAELVYGTGDLDRAALVAGLATALQVPESDARVYATQVPATTARHRLSLALSTAADVTTARDRVQQVSTALRRLWER